MQLVFNTTEQNYSLVTRTNRAHVGSRNCHIDLESTALFGGAVLPRLVLSVPACSAPRYAESLYNHTGVSTEKTPAM
jgi:hypothetical protein